MLTLLSRSAEETRRIGALLAAVLSRPVIALLRGDYGSGKTTLVQGLAAALGVSGAVRSPSYNIVKLYRGAAGALIHVDLYRAHGPAEVAELGIWEFVTDDTVVAIEWPGELVPDLREFAVVTIEFELLPASSDTAAGIGNTRCLRLQAPEPLVERCREVLDEFAAG